MTWERGRDRVTDLIDAGEVQPVPPDDGVARRLLDDAGKRIHTAATARDSGDLSGAYQLVYDALRKSAAALLAAQGLRATTRGGRTAVRKPPPRAPHAASRR